MGQRIREQSSQEAQLRGKGICHIDFPSDTSNGVFLFFAEVVELPRLYSIHWKTIDHYQNTWTEGNGMRESIAGTYYQINSNASCLPQQQLYHNSKEKRE